MITASTTAGRRTAAIQLAMK